jgi:hypothetical protein
VEKNTLSLSLSLSFMRMHTAKRSSTENACMQLKSRSAANETNALACVCGLGSRV